MTERAIPRSCRARAVRAANGFTLLELMVTVAVAAILATLAAPSFRQYILNQRIKNASFDLVSALSLARSEAITRNCTVNVVQTGGNWIGGWTIATDATSCGAATQLFTHEAFNSGISIGASGNLTTITYGIGGRTTTAATVFTVQPASTLNGVIPRYVTICLSGIPRSTTSNSGGC
jgi:type IV fimbrial biogenesis protein FimT